MLKFKNYEISALAKFLFEMKLGGKKSRMRTRFVKQLDHHLTETIQAEQNALIQEYAEKDEDGNILFGENKTEVLLVKNTINEFENEIKDLLNEDYIIGISGQNEEMLNIIATLVLECEDVKFNGNDAVMYDNWCEKFEELSELLTRYAVKEELQI